MSYDRPYRGGRRRYHKDDYDDRRREETPQDKLKNTVIKLGEVDPIQEIPIVEGHIRSFSPPNIPLFAEAFHISVTEQPYKIAYYAALLLRLHDIPSEQNPEEPSLGRLILEEFWKGFQAYVDKLAWRETRFCIHFFAHLTAAKLVVPESLAILLQAFTAVLDEFGVSHGRAKRAALCAAEGLMIGGTSLKAISSSSPSEIINAIQTYIETTNNAKWIVQPTLRLDSTSVEAELADELLDNALAALKALDATDFDAPCPRPYTENPELVPSPSPFTLPLVLVPPEVVELEGLSSEEEESDAQVRKEEWPEYFLRLFTNEITPDPSTPEGYIVRTDLLAILDIFEVNRKECARLLLEYPKWTLPGTFKPKPGAPPPEAEPVVSNEWQLESTILEIVLGASLLLPESSHKHVYYISLITEVCKLSPQTIGPAVGKSIRKIYNSLSDGLDVDIARRFTEWFAIHMSNFNFAWVWKEWVADLSLAHQHPRLIFIRRAIGLEIRLSYYDRVLKTLPEAMQDPEAHVVPEQAPGPNFEYDDPAKPHHDAAQSILNLFRGRSKAEDVIAHLETLRNTLETEASETGQSLSTVPTLARTIAIQSLLHIGSRSFSHLLNAIERYLPLLRTIASGGTSTTSTGGSPEAKADILNAVSTFWKDNTQMVRIVFDKFMQYQIVDPTDVVSWMFDHIAEVDGHGRERENKAPMSLNASEWELLRGALNKAIGRVTLSKRKLTVLRKEDDESRARAKASGGNMDVDKEPPLAENPALTTALKAFSVLTKEQKSVLSRTLEGFVACLAPSMSGTHPNPKVRDIISESAWEDRANWGTDEWNAWETWGWYRQFCTAYSPYLRSYATTLTTISFTRFEGQSDPASDLLQKIWNVSIGQE
ncbi:hypothetical protein D9758_007514 [Tetrapyrgos nigripes]|uniref:Uncharacterized protein n=1 Tax=Tetrapyrgos nigripes TaxID=182062 RepID=A0A8H5LHL2_9AGAR|nr:hypothetical protein D9758_007514 [Tetrapyrgos nigripes]